MNPPVSNAALTLISDLKALEKALHAEGPTSEAATPKSSLVLSG